LKDITVSQVHRKEYMC